MRTVIPYRTHPDSFGAPMYWAVLNIQVSLALPNAPRTKRFEAIIDSGATRCLFHASLAKYLGLNLQSGVCEITNGIGGQEEVWLHDVTLYIPGGPVKIRAGFKENLPVGGLLGTTGFFEHFNIAFQAMEKQCVLDRLYYA